jgi:hypothetical protein
MSLAVRDYTLFLNILISTFLESVCGRPLSGRSGLDFDGLSRSHVEHVPPSERPLRILES